MRLYQYNAGTAVRFAYDGADAVAEYDAANAVQRRYVFDPTTGQPVIWYEGAGITATERRYLSADERGSVISVADANANALAVNRYDDYGVPAATNLGRYQYTAQKWLNEIGVYDYKARAYYPRLGRFLQPDPIGYEGGPNLYSYVLNDPLNATDPFGLKECVKRKCEPPIIVRGTRLPSRGSHSLNRGGQNGAGGDRGASERDPRDKGQRETENPDESPCPTATPLTPHPEQANPNFVRPVWEVLYKLGAGIRSLSRFPGHNDATDAQRHFRWSFSMAQAWGVPAASDFLNHHEIADPNPPGETQMDAYNNGMGLAFATDPRYQDMDPDDAAKLALKSGCLKTGIK